MIIAHNSAGRAYLELASLVEACFAVCFPVTWSSCDSPARSTQRRTQYVIRDSLLHSVMCSSAPQYETQSPGCASGQRVHPRHECAANSLQTRGGNEMPQCQRPRPCTDPTHTIMINPETLTRQKLEPLYALVAALAMIAAPRVAPRNRALDNT